MQWGEGATDRGGRPWKTITQHLTHASFRGRKAGKGHAMNVKDYWQSMSMELTAWKAKLYDVINKVDKLGTAEREKVLGNIEDLKMAVAEIEDRVGTLQNECPADWSGVRQEIEQGHVDLRGKYDETMEYLGKAAPVSVPG